MDEARFGSWAIICQPQYHGKLKRKDAREERFEKQRGRGQGGPVLHTVPKLADHASCLPQLPQILPLFRVSDLQTNTGQGILAKQPGLTTCPQCLESERGCSACPQARESVKTSDKASGFHISGQSHHAGGQ